MMNFSERYEMLFEISRTEDRNVAVFRDRETNIPVVIKQYKNLSSSNVDQLRREIGLAAQLNHPFIARATHIDQNEYGHYLVSDFVAGLTLGQLAKIFGCLDENTIGYIAEQIFEGISHCHVQGILHKDLKPENILLDFKLSPQALKDCLEDYRAKNYAVLKKRLGPALAGSSAKIIDFGIAQTAESTNHAGTPAFSSPEQLQKKTLDSRTDIFSAGLVLYFIGSGGSLPHIAADEFGKLNRSDILSRMKDWKVHSINGLSDRLNQIIAGCLRLETSERYKSALDILSALKITDTFNEKTKFYNEDISGATVAGGTDKYRTESKAPPKTDASAKENTGTNTVGSKTEEKVSKKERPMPYRDRKAIPAQVVNAAPVVSAFFAAAAAGIIYVIIYLAGLNIDPAITGGGIGLLVAVFISERLDEIDIVIFALTGSATAKITALCCKSIGFASTENEAALFMAAILISGLSFFYAIRIEKGD